MKRTIGLAGALMLAACGGGQRADNHDGSTADAPAGVTAAKVDPPSGFDVTDACTILDRTIVAAVMGSAVTRAEVSGATAPTADTAGFSNCAYTLANGMTPQFFARWSPDGDADAATNEKTVTESAALFKSKAEKVDGLASPAWWVGGPNQLHIFPDAHRYVFFTMTFPGMDPKPSEAQAMAWAIAMAKRAGY